MAGVVQWNFFGGTTDVLDAVGDWIVAPKDAGSGSMSNEVVSVIVVYWISEDAEKRMVVFTDVLSFIRKVVKLRGSR